MRELTRAYPSKLRRETILARKKKSYDQKKDRTKSMAEGKGRGKVDRRMEISDQI